MNKEQKATVLEYAASLSEDVLRSLTLRLSEKLSEDLAEAVDEMSKDRRMDKLLSAAGSAEALFNLLDSIRDVLQKECKKKGLLLKLAPSAA